MCEVVSKNIALKPIVFQKNALFSNMCTFLSHCFETKNYHWPDPKLFYLNTKEFGPIVLLNIQESI